MLQRTVTWPINFRYVAILPWFTFMTTIRSTDIPEGERWKISRLFFREATVKWRPVLCLRLLGGMMCWQVTKSVCRRSTICWRKTFSILWRFAKMPWRHFSLLEGLSALFLDVPWAYSVVAAVKAREKRRMTDYLLKVILGSNYDYLPFKKCKEEHETHVCITSVKYSLPSITM